MRDRQPSDPDHGRPDSFLRRWFGWLFALRLEPPEPRPLNVLGRSPFRKSARSAAYAARVDKPAPMAPVTAKWKVVEPPPSADATSHQVWQGMARPGGWILQGASIRGRLHAHQGNWRDDAFHWAVTDDWTCLAVADGAGSAPLSRVGARIACDECMRSLTAALAGWRPQPGADGSPAVEDLRSFRAALAAAARQALLALQDEAKRRHIALRDFDTTALLFAHVPFGAADLVGALQIGDGAIGLFTTAGDCHVLGVADHGAFASETRFLTTPGIENGLEKRIVIAVLEGLRAVALMTDGVADDFFPESEKLRDLFDAAVIPDLHTASGGVVSGVLRSGMERLPDGRLLAEWLQYEKRGSSDDRTLVLFSRTNETSNSIRAEGKS